MTPPTPTSEQIKEMALRWGESPQQRFAIETEITNLLTQARLTERKRWEDFRKVVESNELIDLQQHWLTKSLEDPEYVMAMDSLRGYRRDLLEALDDLLQGREEGDE